MNKTEMMMAQIISLLKEIRDELHVTNAVSKREIKQKIAESKTRQKQMKKQMLLAESSKRI